MKDIDKLEKLIADKLHPFFTVIKKIDNSRIACIEINLRLKNEEEITALIRKLENL